MQAWIVEWLDLLNLGNNKAVSSIIETMTGKDLSLNNIVLFKKYSDFLNMFDKTWIDILL